MIKKLILVLLMCAPCWAANDPTGDPNCVAYYPFTAVSPFTDATANGNDFAYQTLVAVDTVNMKTGDGCADFELDDETNIWTDDSVLSADFPARSTDSNPCFSVTGWFNPESAVDNGNLVNKYYHSTNKRCWAVASFVTSNYVWVGWGYNSGSSVRQYTCTVTDGIDTGQWYFFHVVFDDPNNTCDIRVYDATEDKWALSENTPTDAMNCEDSQLFFGRQGGGNYFDGLLDEVAIFTKVLSNADANSIVAGTYDYASEPNVLSVYQMDTKGLAWDDQENNHMRGWPIPNQTGPGSLRAVQFGPDTVNPQLSLPDASLSAKFPGKNGASQEVMTICFWLKPDNPAADYEHIVGKAENTDGWITGYDITRPIRILAGEFAGDPSALVEVAHDMASGTWYHFAAVIDVGNTRVYGRLYDSNDTTVYTIETTSASFADITTTYDFKIGYLEKTDDEFNGAIAEVIIFNRILTANEIDEIRNGTFGASSNANWWRRRHNN